MNLTKKKIKNKYTDVKKRGVFKIFKMNFIYYQSHSLFIPVNVQR